MSQSLIRAGAVLLLCTIGAVAAALLLLPRFADAPRVRTAIREAWNAELGARIEWASTTVQWQPLALELSDVRLGLPEHEGLQIDLALAGLKLIVDTDAIRSGRIELDALVVERQRVDFDGLFVPGEDPSEKDETRVSGHFDDFEARVDVEQETFAVALDASGRLFVAQPELEPAPELGSGAGGLAPAQVGEVSLSVRISPEANVGPFTLVLDRGDLGLLHARSDGPQAGAARVAWTLEAFDLTQPARWLSLGDREISGRATGGGHGFGALTNPDRVELDLEIEAGRLRLPDYRVDGSFRARLEAAEPMGAGRSGRLELDLTEAAVRYKAGFTKEAGKPAEVVTKFAPDSKGETRFETRVELRQLDGVLRPGGF